MTKHHSGSASSEATFMGLDPDTSKIVMGCIVAAMILLAGCMSGLNLSLMSLDTGYLKVLKRSRKRNGNELQRYCSSSKTQTGFSSRCC
jgi:hypothetical protein